jgi:dihydrofolate reductase
MKSNISIIMAVDDEGGFGVKGKLPWHFPEDLKFFQQQTQGRCCVMGRTTYNEINEMVGERGKISVLPGRVCYVLSRNPEATLPNATVVQSLGAVPCNNYFVIGGRSLYNQALGYASRIYLTKVAGNYHCDVSTNMRYINSHFHEIETFPSNTPELTFSLLERNT